MRVKRHVGVEQSLRLGNGLGRGADEPFRRPWDPDRATRERSAQPVPRARVPWTAPFVTFTILLIHHAIHPIPAQPGHEWTFCALP